MLQEKTLKNFCERLPSDIGEGHLQLTPEWMMKLMYHHMLKGNVDKKYMSLTPENLEDKAEEVLKGKIQDGEYHALFLLGQLYFQQGRFEEAEHFFHASANNKSDWQSMYQLGVIYYDGMGTEYNPQKGVEYMTKVATSTSVLARHLVPAAQYNIGLAHYNGVGFIASLDEAEKYWLMAADISNKHVSVKAQSMLGMLYSTGDKQDLEKAFFWHNEACGNGNLESQGALGVMHANGLGTKKNLEAAFTCFKEAANRGNVYAAGNLVGYYYRNKLYTKASGLAARLAEISEDSICDISRENGCLPSYIRKGLSMACYYYARCLAEGHAVVKDQREAKRYFSRSLELDPDTCSTLTRSAHLGEL